PSTPRRASRWTTSSTRPASCTSSSPGRRARASLKLSHFERLAPICVACRKGALGLSKVIQGSPKELEESLLECPECRHLFPIIDGIPLLARDVRRVISEQILSILQRTDLSERTLELLG